MPNLERAFMLAAPELGLLFASHHGESLDTCTEFWFSFEHLRLTIHPPLASLDPPRGRVTTGRLYLPATQVPSFLHCGTALRSVLRNAIAMR